MTNNEINPEKMNNEETEAKVEANDQNTEQETDVCSEDSQELSGEEKSSENPVVAEDEDLNTRYIRLMADFQNFKKRTEKQRSEIHAYANEKIITQLISVMDNFERALQAECQEGDSFREGMEMIFKQLKDVLTNSGVEEIIAENAEFDPNFHNAVMMEDTDKVESGKVSEVLQKGYILNGRVIRAAMVKVAN